MNDSERPKSPGRRHGCLLAIAALAGVVVLLLLFAPIFRKWNEDAMAKAAVAKVKQENTGKIYCLKPQHVESLLQDDECREKITEVGIVGDFVPDVSDKRFRSLSQFPQLKIIHFEYVGLVDTFLEGIQGMPSLEELTFHRAGVSEKGMRYILSFPNLKRLSIDNRTPLPCLDALKGHAGIESLGLYEYQTSADHLTLIKSLPNLRELSLELELTGGGVLDLHGLPKLERLNLGDSLAKDTTLVGVEEMTNLTNLDLSGHQLTDAGLVHLQNCQKLKRLHLMWQSISDAGLRQLSDLASLEDLDLCKTKITDSGLTYLKKMKTLRWLNLSLTQVTDQGIKELRRALPNCVIEWRPPTKE